MQLEELMQTLNYAKKGRGRDFLIQQRMKNQDPMKYMNSKDDYTYILHVLPVSVSQTMITFQT